MRKPVALLEVKNLSFTVDSTKVLSGLNLEFWEGYVHAVVGPNGAGKSTLANIIMGLPDYRAATGDILFEGTSIMALPIDERARLGITLAWQEPARFEGLTVRNFLLAAAREKTDSEIDKALDLVGLAPDRYRDRALDKTLSGGERKRIELASILAMRPRLVLLDEPDSGVDIEAIERIFSAIARLKEQGATVLLITHSPAVLEKADHAFLICCGQLMDKGETAKILRYFSDRCMPCPHVNEPGLNGRGAE
jgi:Fe-S cluster assembly ATP-binding protein